ncbi:MAG TPA: hypothetical protein VHP33_30750 [Polyangiaceae bacterium]|nr:hypothetical protein [Polyangiaceae bacterium]
MGLLLPPADGDVAPETSLALSGELQRPTLQERWSVKLELGDDEIAKLYGQGMARGAVVWKKGMHEWRPLLITPELSGLLRRTRITLTETPPLPTLAQLAAPLEEPTLPRAARVPFETPPQLLEKPAVPSVAPTALDVEPSPSKAQPRRPIELALVGLGAFALAWLGHATLNARSPAEMPPITAPAAAAVVTPAPACEPAPAAPTTLSSSPGIPTVSVADLPLAGAKGASAATVPAALGGAGKASRASASSDGRPSRSDLVAALGQVARAASSCGERGGPVRVVVSFANSGVARSVQVSGADLPSTTRSCMIGAASRARVPAFTGDPVTVSKTL